MRDVSSFTYLERLRTFEGFWEEHHTTARQLAAIGHVYDRPPLEALEEGSRCITCSAFVRRDRSVQDLGDAPTSSPDDDHDDFTFHHPNCVRLQVRLPLDRQALLPGRRAYRMNDLRAHWERKSSTRTAPTQPHRASQTSSLFNLPTEMRVEIYKLILPSLDPVTEIVNLNRDSSRVITSAGYHRTGPRDLTRANILQACRAVNEEAMDLLYTKTTFKFANSKVMYLFLRSIGEAGRGLIKDIDVYCGGREDAVAFALLAGCKKLRSIIIRLPRPMLLFPRAPIWIVDGVSALLALGGLEKVTFGACESFPSCMGDGKPDAAIIVKELTRPRGSPGDHKVILNYLDT